MPLQATSGAASYDAFGGGVPVVPNYIEDVFSDYLFSGTSASNTINNGVDASGKGALVWIKDRGAASTPHMLFDTTRGVGKYIQSNSTGSQGNIADTLTAFNSNGFTLGADSFGVCNASGHNYVSWMFREAPKFFDVVTYTGTSGTQVVSHNLGVVPGCLMMKSTSTTGEWIVNHRSLPTGKSIILNQTGGSSAGSSLLQNATSTTFEAPSYVNQSGVSYVAYLFAHNAGGFGLTGTDNVISCGSFTTDGGGNGSATLGYEPQWVLFKRTTGAQNWVLMDNMRNFVASPNDSSALYPNLSSAESVFGQIAPNATGFSGSNFSSSSTYIYIAIRRGPMKVPTSGTSVFSPVAANSGYDTFQTTGFPIDTQIVGFRNGLSLSQAVVDRLRGVSTVPSNTTYNSPLLSTSSTSAETTSNTSTNNWNNTGFSESLSLSMNDIYWNFRRAPSFFDVVCYTGTGSARTVAHNLGVAPELIFIKCRSAANQGLVYNKTITAEKFLTLFSTSEGAYAAQGPDSGPFNSTEPTSSVFSVGTYSNTNGSGATYVAYLFATCAGVSKVGTYTGTGTTLQIDCGFTAGARFVLIKRTSYPASGNVAGGWYVWDSARGIVSGNDPYLLLNTTDAEVTNTDYIDTYNAGFEISSTAPIQINESGKTYIYLAIA